MKAGTAVSTRSVFRCGKLITFARERNIFHPPRVRSRATFVVFNFPAWLVEVNPNDALCAAYKAINFTACHCHY